MTMYWIEWKNRRPPERAQIVNGQPPDAVADLEHEHDQRDVLAAQPVELPEHQERQPERRDSDEPNHAAVKAREHRHARQPFRRYEPRQARLRRRQQRKDERQQADPPNQRLVLLIQLGARPHRVHHGHAICLRRVVVRRPRQVERGEVRPKRVQYRPMPTTSRQSTGNPQLRNGNSSLAPGLV